MRIIATYIIKDTREFENDSYYKMHECIGINNFTKEYFLVLEFEIYGYENHNTF